MLACCKHDRTERTCMKKVLQEAWHPTHEREQPPPPPLTRRAGMAHALSALEHSLLVACEGGDMALLQQACTADPCLLARTRFGIDCDTMAHIAAFYAQGSVLGLIHRVCPALLTSISADGRLPAHEAAASGSASTIGLLSRLGAADSLFAPGVVRTAAAGGHVDVMRAIVAATSGKVNILDASADGFTSAHAATCCGHVEALLFLHEMSIDSLYASTLLHGWTCAHMAACSGHANCLALLGRLGVPLDCCSWPECASTATVRPFELACRTSLSCTMQLAVDGVDTSIAVLPAHLETQQLSEDVIQFLYLLQGKARVLSAMLRLKFKAGIDSANKHKLPVLLCDDLVEKVGQLITPARVARALHVARELQCAHVCFEGYQPRNQALARSKLIIEGDTRVPRKRRCTRNEQ